MARKKAEVIPQEDDVDLLEASDDNQEQLDEFTADNTGGDAGTAVKPAEVPEPASTGSSARSADKSAGDKSPPNPSAMVSKAHLMSNVISSMNKMNKSTLQKVADDVAKNYKGNKKSLPASKDPAQDPPKKLVASVQGVPPKTARESAEEIFAGQELNEETLEKASTIFEATINGKIIEVSAHLEEQYQEALVEEKEKFITELTDRVDEYLSYVAEEWMTENEVALTNAVQVEVAESFMSGIKDLFAENYVDVADDKVDVVDELTQQNSELEARLDEAIQKNIDESKSREELEAFKILVQASDGLSMNQKEKLAQLAEGIEYEDTDDYSKKIEMLKEHYFDAKPASSDESLDSEEDPVEIDEEDASTGAPLPGQMAAYASAISRTVRK
jgi:hypothetical protein